MASLGLWQADWSEGAQDAMANLVGVFFALLSSMATPRLRVEAESDGAGLVAVTELEASVGILGTPLANGVMWPLE